jgi:hypothetical protein
MHARADPPAGASLRPTGTPIGGGSAADTGPQPGQPVEVQQSVDFVTHWRTNAGFTDLDRLPFDYTKELVGAPTPYLPGQVQWLPTAHARGFRHDASNPGGFQTWPGKLQDVSSAPTRPTAPRSSSATNSRRGEAASTWTPSRTL